MSQQTGKNHRFLQSLGYAWEGLVRVFKEERNFRFHCLAAIVALLMGLVFSLSPAEWLWILQAIVLVLVLEIINTLIENLVDEMTQRTFYPWAKKVKDLAAGMVWLSALYAVLVGLIIFIPHIIK